MAKKQTRRSISVSRTTYEKLKAFCEANNISMSQFVETRVGDFLGEAPAPAPRPAPSPSLGGMLPRPSAESARPLAAAPIAPRPSQPMTSQSAPAPVAAAPRPVQVPMTSAAARYAVEPPPPIIKPKSDHDAAAPAPVVKTADQIFTF
jgi:hypothetical protein